MVVSEDVVEGRAVEEFTIILKLVERIKTTIKNSIKDIGTNEADEIVFNEKLEDLKKLKILCSSDNAVTSLTACQGMVSLVHSNCIKLQYAFTFFRSLYYTGSVPKGQSSAVLNLLLLDLKAQLSEKGKYANPIRSTTKHPLCRILRQDPNSWKDVLNLMSSVINHYDKNIRDNAIELLKPVFIFILTDPKSSLSETCSHHTWKMLVEKLIAEDKNAIFDYFSSPFFQCSTRNPLEICYDIIVTSQICQSDIDLKSALTLILTSLISDVLNQGYDPCFLLSQLNVLLDSSEVPSSVLLIILSQSIRICPASFLSSLLDFCEWLINKGQCSYESIWMCALACLPWLNNCVSLSLKSVHKSIMAIMAEATTGARVPNQVLSLIKNPHLPKVINFNRNIPLAIHTARFCDELRNKDEAFIVEWLKSIPIDLIPNVYLLVETIMSCREETSVRMSALKTLQRAPVSFASQNLMFFTYQLAREKDPKIQLELLKSIVSTAADKKNIPHVMRTIKTMQNSGQPVLQILAVDLCLQLWLINELCYPFLLSVLTENEVNFPPKENRQMDIARAAAIYQICLKAPEKHGKELVQPLQNLLIKCQGADGAVASSLIMKSLAALIRAKILSPSSTWVKLQPLLEDLHPSVCVSMCELVGVAVQQSCTEEVNNSISSWLWKLILSSESELVVVEAAFSALREFNVETLKFTSIPEIFKKNISLPSDQATSGLLEDAIPGDCWIQLLENVRLDARQAACETIACWLDAELKRNRAVYDANSPYPENYNRLPHYSVCRSLYNQLRRSWNKNDDKNNDMVKMILQIFNSERSKLLLPVDWKFIYNCLQVKQFEESVLALMARESKGCMSANTFIKNYLNGKDVSIKFVYEHLPDLIFVCYGLETSVREKLLVDPLSNEKDGETVCYYFDCLKKVIVDPSIEISYKSFLIDIIENAYKKISENDPAFSNILDCCTVAFSDRSVMKLTNQTMVEFPLKAYKLNYKMAMFGKLAETFVEESFNYLHQCIEIYSQFTRGDLANASMANVSPLSDLKAAFIKFRTHEYAWTWAIERLRKIVQYRGDWNDQKCLDFLCSVFISAVLHFSEISVVSAQLMENAEEFYFPLALKLLHDKHKERSASRKKHHPETNDYYLEVLELLQELVASEMLTDESVKRVFNSAIAADFTLTCL